MRTDTARSARLLREARLRAGLSQQQLAEVSGKDRTVIARYEQGVVAPSVDTLLEIVRSCGFDILLEVVPYEPELSERMIGLQRLSPERRLDEMLDRRREDS
jgi:transcriptional regulator with XRE-family HTH domain